MMGRKLNQKQRAQRMGRKINQKHVWIPETFPSRIKTVPESEFRHEAVVTERQKNK